MTEQRDDANNRPNGVTLREYLEARLEATEDALHLARAELERRLAGMNEFREQLKDQAAKFVTREELDLRMTRLEEKLELMSKGRVSWGVALAMTVLTSATLSMLMLLLTRKAG
jgi:hypothetical protein